MRFRDKVTKEH